MEQLHFTASGKLLLFGEYLVLRGSESMAIPLSAKQDLTLTRNNKNSFLWESYTFHKKWLTIQFSKNLEIIASNDFPKAKLVQQILRLMHQEKENLPISNFDFRFDINFRREFGFGTSSSLISLLAQWSGISPYLILRGSGSGSGYDVAAATVKEPFKYTIEDRVITTFHLPAPVTNHLLFVFMGKKQKSEEEVQKFSKKSVSSDSILKMNSIIESIIHTSTIEEWEKGMEESENMLSTILNVPTVKEQFFKDYPFSVKSLGAWGGDFIMATCRDIREAKLYFSQKGKKVFYTYDDLRTLGEF